MDEERLRKQIDFILETDKLKKIYRKTYLADGSRFENDAEHSWHLALMAIILAEYSNKNIDVLRVIKMVLIHDIIEIDAGDAYCYNESANEGKADREMVAAKRIFAVLPEDQHREFMDLWLEFEENLTAEANFANALDRFQPVNLNYASGGISWKENSIYDNQVITRNMPIEKGSAGLWEYTKKIIDSALQKNYIKQHKK